MPSTAASKIADVFHPLLELFTQDLSVKNQASNTIHSSEGPNIFAVKPPQLSAQHHHNTHRPPMQDPVINPRAGPNRPQHQTNHSNEKNNKHWNGDLRILWTKVLTEKGTETDISPHEDVAEKMLI